MRSGTSQFNKMTKRYRRIQAVPCGYCIECQLSYAQDWAIRAMLESKYYSENECWFLTLTYDNEHLQTHTTVNTETGEKVEGISLKKNDLRKFWKKVRYYYPDKKIVYLDAGEYGPQTNRPHYHAIVFGLPLPLDGLKFYKNNDMGDRIWSTVPTDSIRTKRGRNNKQIKIPSLEQIWGKGFVTVGRLTLASAEYVARYALKKSIDQTNPNWYAAQGKIKEFTSKSQGIGKRYFEEHWKEIYQTDTVPVKKNGELMKPPRVYDRMLKEKSEELYYKVKKKREEDMLTNLRGLYDTGLLPEEQREIQKEVHKRAIHSLRKEI